MASLSDRLCLDFRGFVAAWAGVEGSGLRGGSETTGRRRGDGTSRAMTAQCLPCAAVLAGGLGIDRQCLDGYTSDNESLLAPAIQRTCTDSVSEHIRANP